MAVSLKAGPGYGHFCGLLSCHPRRLTGPGCHGKFCMPADSRMRLSGARTAAALGQQGDARGVAHCDTVDFFVSGCSLQAHTSLP